MIRWGDYICGPYTLGLWSPGYFARMKTLGKSLREFFKRKIYIQRHMDWELNKLLLGVSFSPTYIVKQLKLDNFCLKIFQMGIIH